MSNYAVVINGIVDNIIRYDGGWDVVPVGWTLVKINDNEQVNLGWTYDAVRTPRFMPSGVEE